MNIIVIMIFSTSFYIFLGRLLFFVWFFIYIFMGKDVMARDVFYIRVVLEVNGDKFR